MGGRARGVSAGAKAVSVGGEFFSAFFFRNLLFVSLSFFCVLCLIFSCSFFYLVFVPLYRVLRSVSSLAWTHFVLFSLLFLHFFPLPRFLFSIFLFTSYAPR